MKNIRRAFFHVSFSIMMLFGISSCFKPLSFPEKFGYEVNVSDDMLALFDIEATYESPSNGTLSTPIKEPTWSADFYMSKGFNARLAIHMKAKAGARDGSLIKNETYNMGLTYNIFTPNGLATKSAGTRAGGSSFDTFEFKVPLGGADPDGVTLEMPALKYDKHFAFCFTVDDSYINGWSRIFAAFNARWMDDNDFVHMSTGRTTGTMRDEPMCITDGCGNDRNFTFGEAIWANNRNSYNPDGFIKDKCNSLYSPYISWEELQILTDMGNAVYWHDVDTSKWDVSKVDDIISGMQDDYDKTLSKIGYPMKTMAQPNGDRNYLEAAEKSPLACVTRGTGGFEDVRIRTCRSLYKKNVYGGKSPGDYASKLQELAEQAASSDPLLISLLVHRPMMDCVEFFETINSLYGKNGADNIWVTSYDELYEYIERKNTVTWTSRVENGYKIFTVSVPKEANFRYNELSFIVKGCTKPAERVSENLYGFSSASRGDGTTIVNCNFSDSLITLVEKYVRLYERTHTEEYKLNAEYLVSLLREDLRAPYISRISGVHDPTTTEYPINGSYPDWEMRFYIELYDGFEDSVEAVL